MILCTIASRYDEVYSVLSETESTPSELRLADFVMFLAILFAFLFCPRLRVTRHRQEEQNSNHIATGSPVPLFRRDTLSKRISCHQVGCALHNLKPAIRIVTHSVTIQSPTPKIRNN